MWQPASPELLQPIVSLGQRRGYVAAAEIFTCLPEIEDDPEALAWVLDQLDAADVEVVGLNDSADDAIDRLVDFRPASLDGIESDDTVSLYLREVGNIPLLTADQEVDLAQRIERGGRRRSWTFRQPRLCRARDLDAAGATAKRPGTT